LVSQFQRQFSVLIVVLHEGLKERKGRNCLINNIWKTISDLVQKYKCVKTELTYCPWWRYWNFCHWLQQSGNFRHFPVWSCL